MFKWFVRELNADVAVLNDAKENPFIIAAREGKIDIIRLYLEEYHNRSNFKVDHKMIDGWTALLYSAMNGFAHIVELLVNLGGADINMIDKFHRNALHWACRFNNIKMMEKLLALNIKIDF